MNIRRRFSTLYAAVWAGLYLLFTVVLFSSFHYHLGEEVDESLASWAAQVLGADEGQSGPADPGTAHGPVSRRPDMPETFIVVFTEGGGTLLNQSAFSSQSLDTLRRFAAALGPTGRQRYGRLELDGQRFRVLGKSVAGRAGSPGHTILLGRSLVHVERTVQGLTVSLLVAWSFAVLICSALMWIFVGHTLRPIQAMRVQALNITGSGELSRRVADHGGEDEFSALARALNGMLSALQASDESQKQFLADVSHELRTPLTSIRANLEFMRMAAGAPDADRRAALGDSIAEIDRMAALVNDLLLLARAESPPPQADAKIDLAAIAAEAVAGFRGRRPAPQRRFSVDLPAGPACAAGDGRNLRQAIVMLLDNAFKYTPEGGSIALRLRRVDGQILLSVEDEGPGIPPEEIGAVFGRFYRATNVREKVPGSGLGLSIVQSIVHRHGGSVELKNRTPHGLSVTLRLPACP